MSFREKSAWISFVTILLIFGAYFWRVTQVLRGEARFPFEIAVAFLIAFVLVEIAAHIVVGLQAPKDVRALPAWRFKCSYSARSRAWGRCISPKVCG